VPPPPPPFEAAGLPAQAGQQLLQAAKLKDELRDMQEQLFMLRQSASCWQQVEAKAAGAERQCSATTAKVAALGTDLADLQSSQARMQQASRSSHREVQEKLAALNTQVDALKVQGRGVASATAAELAPLEGRVRQAEEELSALHARLEQQTAAVSAALAAAAASAAAVPEPVSSTPSTSAAELASLQAEVQAMQGAHVSVQQRQDVQREEVLRVSSKLQDVQAAVAAAAKQHTGQLKEFASQHSELGAVRKVAEVHASQIEQLSAQVADVAALVQQQQQQLEQQRQEQLALDVPPVDPEEVRQLSAQVHTSAAAIQDLQQQVHA
jgi:chromosome segregation ATPase